MQVTIYDTDVIFFQGLNLFIVLSPIGYLWWGGILFAFIWWGFKQGGEVTRQKREIDDLIHTLAERNAQIHTLSNEREDARS